MFCKEVNWDIWDMYLFPFYIIIYILTECLYCHKYLFYNETFDICSSCKRFNIALACKYTINDVNGNRKIKA